MKAIDSGAHKRLPRQVSIAADVDFICYSLPQPRHRFVSLDFNHIFPRFPRLKFCHRIVLGFVVIEVGGSGSRSGGFTDGGGLRNTLLLSHGGFGRDLGLGGVRCSLDGGFGLLSSEWCQNSLKRRCRFLWWGFLRGLLRDGNRRGFNWLITHGWDLWRWLRGFKFFFRFNI